jgi:hypothetical protein
LFWLPRAGLVSPPGGDSTRANWLSGVCKKKAGNEGTQESITSQDRQCSHRNPRARPSLSKSEAAGRGPQTKKREPQRLPEPFPSPIHPGHAHGARWGVARLTRNQSRTRQTRRFTNVRFDLKIARDGKGVGVSGFSPASPLLCFKQRSVG